MMSIEESVPALEDSENLSTGATFIGYGTKQIIQSNGWTTVRSLNKAFDSTDSFVHPSALKPITLRLHPWAPDGNSLNLPNCVLPVNGLPEVKCCASSVCVKDVMEVPVNSFSVVLSYGPTVVPSSGTSQTLPFAQNGSDTLPSVDCKTEEGSLSKPICVRSDSEQVDSSETIPQVIESESGGESVSEGSGAEDLSEVDAALLNNNNSKEIFTLQSVKSDKAAARLQLNAVLQSEISKTVKAKYIDVVKFSPETSASNFKVSRSNRSAISLSDLPIRDLPKQNLTDLKTNLSQVVRIQNAKIVEVYEVENKVLPPPTMKVQNEASSIGGLVAGSSGTIPFKIAGENKILVNTGHFDVCNDIFKRPKPPHMILSSIASNKIVEVETDCSVVHPQDLDRLGTTGDRRSYIFESLCISADTLVPVAGRGQRQLLDKANNICSQQSNGTNDSHTEDTPDESRSTMLRCFLCPYFHTEQSKIAKHWIDTHLRQLPYVCSYCDQAFTTSWEVQKHIVKFHPGEKLKVDIKNSSQFASSLSYEVVQSDGVSSETPTAEENIVFARKDLQSCKKCDFQCETNAELRSHQRSFHYKFKPYFCTYCSDRKASFVCNFDLKQHIRVHHPERMPAADAILPKLTADINWSSAYETISIGNQVMFQCRTCAFRSQLLNSAWIHVLLSHGWPKAIACPSCAHVFELSNAQRESFLASCSKCQALVSLRPDAESVRQNSKVEPLYVCMICDYKTMGKGSMNRHLKYNHTKCRPYGCVYCNYVAVERPKVKTHIESLHKGQKIAIKERTDSSEGFRKMVEDLFHSIVRVDYYSELPDGVNTVSIDEASTTNEIDGDDIGIGLRSWKLQKLGVFEDNDADLMVCDASAFEVDSDFAALARDRKPISGEHFKCVICGYVCTDRSCMSRHIKYMHITSRPHSCPYCRYNNVEKTKVRLHVKSHHPNQPKCVKTNKKLLEDMSSEAKRFYIKIDSTGRVVNEPVSLPPMSSDVEMDQDVDMEGNEDSLMNEFVLSELDPETDFIDVKTSQDGATVVLKEGVYQVGIKEEPVDDVEMMERPGIHAPVLNNKVAMLSSALDHNYVIDVSGMGHPLSSNLNVKVKTEPVDSGYEVDVDKLSPTGSGTSVGKTFIDFSSGPSDDEDDDDDDDEDEDLSLVDIPLGASADNLDGLDAFDSDEDDLEEDSDLDLLDFEDFQLDESNHLNFDAVTQNWKYHARQVEWARLQLLRQTQVDSEVKNDPKIWMRTEVEVEDIISRISANKPIMDVEFL